jgi:hypothetical protein
MRVLSKIRQLVRLLVGLDHKLNRLQESVGRIEARQTAQAVDLQASEFRAFSQWGEDGIIQRLVSLVPIERPTFVEFGVQEYTEANTRFLLINDNWSGLVIDGSTSNIDIIKHSEIYWRHNLKAVCAFITRDNINELIGGAGLTGDIGLLSVDIDGNDYWVWEAIDVVSPRIVVVEYNARFGAESAVTVPYDPQFTRSSAHSSMIYYGASLAALVKLGTKKGYDFVGSNSAGNNAFFVRRDVRPQALAAVSAAQGFRQAQFREARGADGQLQYLTLEQERQILRTLPLVEVKE